MAFSENSSNFTETLNRIHQELLAIAEEHQQDGEALLRILRQVELTHREIAEDYFYPSLPERRRELYNLLRDMEMEGGWPYIVRPRLKFILDKFLQVEDVEIEDQPEKS